MSETSKKLCSTQHNTTYIERIIGVFQKLPQFGNVGRGGGGGFVLAFLDFIFFTRDKSSIQLLCQFGNTLSYSARTLIHIQNGLKKNPTPLLAPNPPPHPSHIGQIRAPWWEWMNE
jgi:hypothetical protein